MKKLFHQAGDRVHCSWTRCPSGRDVMLLLCLALAPAGAAAQHADDARPGRRDDPPAVRSMLAVPLAGAVQLDGRLDEPAWALSEVAVDWVQRRPTAGAAPSQRSEARVLYDGGGLYVGFRLHDMAPDSIVATLARRDTPVHSDRVYVLVDSYLDRRTAFRFGVNAAGVKSDAIISGDREESADVGWDAVWEAAVARDSAGWSAELRIPFSQLRFSSVGEDGAGAAWGIQFVREIARTGEQIVWSPSPPQAAGFVSRFGELRGLQAAPPRRLEAVPYVLARAGRAAGSALDSPRRGTALAGAAGGDLRYGVTSNLTLSATLNPDFGQVEADPSEVNLSGSETFLLERRPFFVEGADIFRLTLAEVPWLTDEHLFYSRRIGRAPQGSPPPDAVRSSKPTTTRMLGALKLSGRTGTGWSVGLLDAVTAEERAVFENASGARRQQVVEPLTNFTVTRAARDFREGRSAVGALATSAVRRQTSPLSEALVGRAVVGGLDGRHRFGSDRFEVSGSLVASHLAGSAAAIDEVVRGPVHYFQRPDADHLRYDRARTSLAGASSGVRVEKLAGGFWRYGVAGRLVTPGFDANDLGFHAMSDFGRSHAWLGYQHFRATTQLREWVVWWNAWSTWSLGGERIETGSQLFGEVVRLDNWWGWVSLRHELAALDRARLRGGPAVHAPARSRLRFHTGSDPRGAFSAALGGNLVREWETGGTWTRLQTTAQVRPSPRSALMLEPSVERVESPWQFVGQPIASDSSSRHVVARLAQTTAALTARLSHTFTPDLSIELYAQPFLSTGSYTDFREAGRPRSRRFDERFTRLDVRWDGERYTRDGTPGGTPSFSFERPDFDLQEFSSNLVLRWEYRPGSVLFLVWNQGRFREGHGDRFHLARHAGWLIDTRPDNRLVLKGSYWFSR
jgi:hypothetical protein